MPIQFLRRRDLDLAMDPWIWWQVMQDSDALGPQLNRADRPGGSDMVSLRRVPLIAQLNSAKIDDLQGFDIEPAYRQSAKKGAIVTGFFSGTVAELKALREQVRALKTSRAIQRHLADGMVALKLGERTNLSFTRTPQLPAGDGVVVGFVDNGCPFLHPSFRNAGGGTTRVRRVWCQDAVSVDTEAAQARWSRPLSFQYGWELRGEHIDARLKSSSWIDEDSLYHALGYRMHELVRGRRIDRFTHGGHIMDIACGEAGVAPRADIVFVQLPPRAIRENTSEASARHVLDGVAYIFENAGNRPAVVNLSYGAFAGPHDGSSLLEQGLDQLLAKPNRAIVISAGNGFESECHTAASIEPESTHTLSWGLFPDDLTPNFLEVWHPKGAILEISVCPPSENFTHLAPPTQRSPEPNPIAAHTLTDGNRPVGLVVQRLEDSLNSCGHVLIALNATSSERLLPGTAPTPAGEWQVRISNKSKQAVRFHAWIERDDRGSRPRGEQSRFLRGATSDATVSSLCTGKLPIIVGGYNPATGRVLSYSSAGPTINYRDAESLKGAQKPDVYAPGATDFAGRGVLAAAARNSTDVRLHGTSMAAPFVAGLVALILSEATSKGITLKTRDLKGLLAKGAGDRLKMPEDPPRQAPRTWSDPRDGAHTLDATKVLAGLNALIARRAAVKRTRRAPSRRAK